MDSAQSNQTCQDCQLYRYAQADGSVRTVLTGVFVNLFIRYSQPENGRAPSRAKANVCLDAARTCIYLLDEKKSVRNVPDIPY